MGYGHCGYWNRCVLLTMPSAPLKPCRYPGCPRVQHGSWCDQHRKEDQRRESAQRRADGPVWPYKLARWKRFRLVVLGNYPLCQRCGVATSRDVHHVKSPRTHPDLAFDPLNVEALCKSCHSRETMRGMRADTLP